IAASSSFVFSFRLAPAPRALHPLPTRRSSDLSPDRRRHGGSGHPPVELIARAATDRTRPQLIARAQLIAGPAGSTVAQWTSSAGEDPHFATAEPRRGTADVR